MVHLEEIVLNDTKVSTSTIMHKKMQVTVTDGGKWSMDLLVHTTYLKATFSAPKTKSMKAEAEALRDVVSRMNKAARLALGEEKRGGGGLFDVGGKAPSQSELAKQVRGNATTRTFFLRMMDCRFNKLSYLSFRR